MPTTIGSLPLEVVGQILGSLDEMQSLRHALLACRHFNNAFRETPHNGHRILRNQIPPSLMPLAVAVSKAGSTPELAASPGPLLDALFERPEHLASQLDKLSVQSLGIMSHTHTVIDDFATDFARDAWAKMSDAAGNPQPLHLSPREYIRFLRAFYRTELCYSLCRHRQSARPGGFDETSGPLFFQKLAVWDNEQIGSVQEYFEPRFRQAAYEPLAHDVEFGESMVDYLQYGFDSNPGQRWITRGVVFMHAVINAACYDDKLELLQSTFNTVSGNLRQTLWTSFYAYKDLFPIPNYREAMQAAFPESTGVDKGPFEAWRLMLDKDNIDMGVYYFMDNEAWLRERGYVFWDWERIVEHNLAKVITELGHEVDDPFDDQELEDMEESWDERSLVWQKGGRGYWSKDDLSRIEWPPGREPQPQV